MGIETHCSEWPDAIALVTAAGIHLVCLANQSPSTPPAWHARGIVFVNMSPSISATDRNQAALDELRLLRHLPKA